MAEKYLGVILWASADGSNGVLADIEGGTWRFKETATIANGGSLEYVSVYQNGWKPKTTVRANPASGKTFVSTEPSIVFFTLNQFTYRDGRAGHTITSVEDATGVLPEDADRLFIVREKWEMQKSAERRARHELRKTESSELGFWTRCYTPR